ncbi:hypothetical protein MRX96_039518 [Rhipicephalus microplus]
MKLSIALRSRAVSCDWPSSWFRMKPLPLTVILWTRFMAARRPSAKLENSNMNRFLGTNLIVAVAVAIAVIIMAPNEAAAIDGDFVNPLGRKK